MNVYFLLDRSGSMSSLWSEAIGSINAYVNKLESDTKVVLAAFDNQSYDILRDSKVKDWNIVEQTELAPRGMTPLYDSCGKLMSRALEDNAEKTVLVVMTDGYENCSKEYSNIAIKAKIKTFEEKGWEVIFLGANFDVRKQASDLNVASWKTAEFKPGNFVASMDTLATSTRAYASGIAMNLTKDQPKGTH